MNRLTLFLCLALVASLQTASAAKNAMKLNCATAVGITTEAEVAPVPGQGIYVMDVTFIGKTPPNKEIDRILRDCLAAAVKRDGTKDILGSAWLRKRVGN